MCFKERRLFFRWKIGPVSFKPHTQRKRAVLMLLLTVDQKVTLSVSPVDDKGNPAKLDGVPVWSVSDDTILTVTASQDGLSAVVDTVGALGTAQVSVTADADLGSGVRNLSGALDVQVVAGEAATLSISSDAPVQK